MYISDIIKNYNWEDISATMFILYPNQRVNEGGYKEVFQHLNSIKEPTISNDSWIQLYEIVDDTNKKWIDITKMDRQGKRWAMGFAKQKEWLGMDIRFSKKLNFTDKEMLCHILYEMTYHGFRNY